MQKIILLSLLAIAAVSAPAQKIRLRSTGTGKVLIVSGAKRALVDLTGDVAGCAFTASRTQRKNDCAAPPASFKLLDAIVKDNETFLVIQTNAMGNCNVCGRCGASDGYSLIWLKLDSRLRLAKKQSVPVEYCLDNISGLDVKPHESDNLSDLSLKFRDSVLTTEFEKTIFNDNSEISGYEFSHLEYNRKTPEKGFVIKTEKRGKSSNNE